MFACIVVFSIYWILHICNYHLRLLILLYYRSSNLQINLLATTQYHAVTFIRHLVDGVGSGFHMSYDSIENHGYTIILSCMLRHRNFVFIVLVGSWIRWRLVIIFVIIFHGSLCFRFFFGRISTYSKRCLLMDVLQQKG